MNTIQSVQTLAADSNIPSITVTVEQQYDSPRQVGQKNSWMSKWKVKDATGSCRMTVFSDNPPTMQPGATYSVSSAPGRNGIMAGVSSDHYNGSFSGLKVQNSAVILPAGAAPAAAPQADPYAAAPAAQPAYVAPVAQQPAVVPAVTAVPGASGPDKYMASFLTIYSKSCNAASAAGIDAEKAHQVALKAAECYPLYWFGEKGCN
jgi:hypothetical protein